MNHKRIECKDRKAKSGHENLTRPPRLTSQTAGVKDANEVAAFVMFHQTNAVQEYMKTLYH